MNKYKYSFKVFLFSYGIFISMPLFLTYAILSYFHQTPANINGEKVYGWLGAFTYILFGLLWGTFIAALNWGIVTFGDRIYFSLKRRIRKHQ